MKSRKLKSLLSIQTEALVSAVESAKKNVWIKSLDLYRMVIDRRLYNNDCNYIIELRPHEYESNEFSELTKTLLQRKNAPHSLCLQIACKYNEEVSPEQLNKALSPFHKASQITNFKLDLSSCKISKKHIGVLTTFLQRINQSNVTSLTLILSDNPICADSIERISCVLGESRSIYNFNLDLSFNQVYICERFAQSLNKLLLYASSLRRLTLNLGCTTWNSIALTMLSTAITEASTLSRLNIQTSTLSDFDKSIILNGIKENTTALIYLYSYHMRPDKLDDDICRIINHCHKRNILLKKYRHYPELIKKIKLASAEQGMLTVNNNPTKSPDSLKFLAAHSFIRALPADQRHIPGNIPNDIVEFIKGTNKYLHFRFDTSGISNDKEEYLKLQYRRY